MNAFALNHRVAPTTGCDALFRLAVELGAGAVELRNDLPGIELPTTGGGSATGLRVLSINALQRFNEWTPEREAEAKALAAEARAIGCEALVLVPVNENGWRPGEDARRAALVEALRGLAPILADADLVGLVEPLGFEECTLRFKRDAIAGIDASGAPERFKLVHDTFHHFVAGENEIFPDRTGLVHISGVDDPAVPRAKMRDPHRVLVGPADRLDNVGQLRTLEAGGYRGLLSFEPFADAVSNSADIAGDLRQSMEFIAAGLEKPAA